jgi:hypothetical protein
MQLLGNLLPSAPRDATLSFGLFTSRLRLSMQIFGFRRWCRRICNPFRQSGRSCWNSCPMRSTSSLAQPRSQLPSACLGP